MFLFVAFYRKDAKIEIRMINSEEFMLKKVLSALLAAVLICVMLAPTVAKANFEYNPVLFIGGIMEFDFVRGDGTSASKIFPISSEGIGAALKDASPAITGLINKDYEAFTKGLNDPMVDLFAGIVCNFDGTVADDSVHIVGRDTYMNESKLHTKEKTDRDIWMYHSVDEIGMDTVMASYAFGGRDIIYPIIEKVGSQNTYVYGLDWRMPMEWLADDLADQINYISKKTGKKVSVAAHSMGGSAISSYIMKYGTGKLSHITYLHSAFFGVNYIGDLYSGKCDIDSQGLLNMMTSSMGTSAVADILGASTLFKQAIPYIEEYIKTEDPVLAEYKDIFGHTPTYFDRLMVEYLLPYFGNNPSLFAFVKADRFEECKAYLKKAMKVAQKKNLGLSDIKIALNWASFENKIDFYQNTSHPSRKATGHKALSDILLAAEKKGVIISVFSAYNRAFMAIGESTRLHSDGVIDTKGTSAGATIADFNEQLPEDYKPQGKLKYISPDGVIDASTCLFPEHTFFTKNVGHSQFDNINGCCDLWVYAMTAPKSFSVNEIIKDADIGGGKVSTIDAAQFRINDRTAKTTLPLKNILGDVNLDGTLDLTDARLILRYEKGLASLAPWKIREGDINKNGKSTAEDAQMLIEAVARAEFNNTKDISEKLEDVVKGKPAKKPAAENTKPTENENKAPAADPSKILDTVKNAFSGIGDKIKGLMGK